MPVTVRARSMPNGKFVGLTEIIEQEAYKEHGQAALARWIKLQTSWRKDKLLIDPLAQYQAKKERGIQEGTKNKIKRLREIRLEDLEDNGSVRSKKAAMGEVQITDKTWRKYDLKTYDNWDIKSYKPGKCTKTE